MNDAIGTRITDPAMIDRLWARAGKWDRHFPAGDANGRCEWFARRGKFGNARYEVRCRYSDCTDLGCRWAPVLAYCEFYRLPKGA